MNLPNKLTIFRIILVPVFLVLLLCPLGLPGSLNRYLALGVFIVASITDCLDGYIARRYNLVTDFGKFMDPLADKLLCCSAMIALIGIPDAVVSLPSVVVIIIIAREFLITGFRSIAAEKGIVIAASKWGKLKTISQMIMLILLILNLDIQVFKIITVVIMVLATALTIISAVDYILKNKDVLKG
ncbi:MAG: CDP-diacylglycerol--glycerol-3-phosphate 3-phosphatidyltransferase [Clostridiales bacterium]|nr:CDP-diacylglycerol--glycerol-3-phosphate 3-phosphatidyltransferase [Clostridiales bacterium]